MKTRFYRMWFYGLLTFLAVAVSLRAEENCDYECCDQECPCGGSCAFGGEWLYWGIEESKLEYGAAVNIVDGGNNNTFVTSKILQPTFQYNNGYRLFADYCTSNHIQMRMAYNHISTRTSDEFRANSMLSMNFATIFNANFPILTAIANNPLNTLGSRWNDKINYFDVDFSKTMELCTSFNLFPHLGARFLWCDQIFRVYGTGVETPLAFNSRLRGRIRGLGLEGGIGACWYFCDGFSLIGNLGGSLLYVRYDNQGNLFATVDGMGSLNIQYKNHVYRGLPMFDALIGLQYITCFSDYVVSLRAGWEQHVIFETNEFSVSGSGNTTLQGLFLGGVLGF